MKFITTNIFIILLFTAQQCFSANEINQFGITWKFDRDYPTGQFANGDYWVLGPVTIINIDPPSTDFDNRVMNGSMINPSPKLGSIQGYDSSMYGQYGPHFNPELNAARPDGNDLTEANPLIVQPGSSLVSTISHPEQGHRPQLKTAAILTVLKEPPAQGSFRPPYCTSDKTIKFNKNQLNYSLLKKLKPVPTVPDLSTVESYFERPWLDHVPGWMGRSLAPSENRKSYDRDLTTQVGIGALMLHLNFTDQQKEKLLISYVQVGIDLYGVIQDSGRTNWRQDTGRKFPIIFAGLMLDCSDMKNIGFLNDPASPLFVEFEEDNNTFFVTQIDIDLTSGSSWNPDKRSAQLIPYTKNDIGLPEWGIIKKRNVKPLINKYWGAIYRTVIGHAYNGVALAVHIMGIKDLWNHDAFLDYVDRYRQVETQNVSTSKFVLDMWDYYRPQLSSIWTMSPELNIISINGSIKKVPDKITYKLGEQVILKAVPDDGYEFTSWSGDITGSDSPVQILMHANQSITANFRIQRGTSNSKSEE